MSVSVAYRLIDIDPIADLSTGIMKWEGFREGTGDASGGEIDFTLAFDSPYLFGGQWYFTLESFNTKVTADLGASGVMTIKIVACSNPDYYNEAEWSRKYNISRYEGIIDSVHAVAPKYLWKPVKPPNASQTPSVKCIIYPNVNLVGYQFRAHGYVLKEGSPASMMLAAR